jgi:hypothetical protein
LIGVVRRTRLPDPTWQRAAVAEGHRPRPARPTYRPYVSELVARDIASSLLEHLDRDADLLWVKGVRVTCRGTFGFTSFTIEDGAVDTHPPAASPPAAKSAFALRRGHDDTYVGSFRVAYPEREIAGPRHDMTIRRDGRILLRSTTGRGAWRLLEDTACQRGPEGQVVVSGRLDDGPLGSDVWSFVVSRAIVV